MNIRPLFKQLKFLRLGYAVKRWHTQAVHKQQTVGEHSINVAAIACYLYGEWDLDLVMAAMLHDTPEAMTGDVPAIAKWSIEGLNELLDKAEGDILDEIGFPRICLTPKQLDCLKAADMLELVWFCAEEINMGNMSMRLVFERGLKYLNRYGDWPEVTTIIKGIENELRQTRAING